MQHHNFTIVCKISVYYNISEKFRRATKHGECMRGAQEFECCDELDTMEIPEHKIITNIDIASVLTQLCISFRQP